MAPADDGTTPAADPMAEEGEEGGKQSSGLGAGGSSYVPPHMRKGAQAGGGDRMGGKFERDDLATLRVTNVSRSMKNTVKWQLLTFHEGFRDGRRARNARLVRTFRPCHSCFPGKGPGNRTCKGLRIRLFRGPC